MDLPDCGFNLVQGLLLRSICGLRCINPGMWQDVEWLFHHLRIQGQPHGITTRAHYRTAVIPVHENLVYRRQGSLAEIPYKPVHPGFRRQDCRLGRTSRPGLKVFIRLVGVAADDFTAF